MLVPENKQPASRVIVLGTNWDQRPWGEAEDVDKPEKWDLPALIVLPSPVEVAPNNGIRGLGQWLVQHVPAKRNTARFLILASDEKGIFQDEDLLFAARCAYLTSQAWVGDPKCKALKEEFDKPLRDRLKARFDRFAILRRWDFQSPEQCLFEIERIEKRGSETAFEVERKILSDLFDPAAFQKLALDYARNLRLVGDLLKELSEPPPATVPEIIPFLGETAVYERILQIAAQGILVLNVSGNWIGRLPEHSSDQEAYQHIRTKAFRSGPEMRQVQLGLPSAVGGTTVPSPKPQPPALPPPAVPPVVPPVPVFPPPPTYPPAEPPVTPPSTVGEPPSAPTQPAPAALPVVHRTDKPASGLNLSGCFETWGVPLTVTLSSARIEFSDLSVPQLKQILMKLPSAFKASLEVSYPEETKEP
jgi:hypothetical protein